MARRTICAVFTAFLVLSASAVPTYAETDPAALVDALAAVFGKHPGKRGGHANGICVKGSFLPTPEAAKLSKAPQFAATSQLPFTGRFSMGGGDPDASNMARDNPRGLAVHIDLGKGATTDLVLLSAPVFLSKTPEDFLTLLQTVATKDEAKIGAFFKAHPESTAQGAWLQARPVPASYASVTYYGVHVFTFTNADGEKKSVKLKVIPVAGEVGLSDDELKSKAPDFYTAELKEQLTKGPAEFSLVAVIGEPKDPLDDPTALWSEAEHQSVTIGRFKISEIAPNETCDAGMFDPNNLADGMEGAKGDLILPIRSPAYAISLSRRLN